MWKSVTFIVSVSALPTVRETAAKGFVYSYGEATSRSITRQFEALRTLYPHPVSKV